MLKLIGKSLLLGGFVHLTLAIVPILILAALLLMTGFKFCSDYLYSVFCLFTGLLLLLSLPLGWNISLFVATAVIVRTGVVLHYAYRAHKQPDVRSDMYIQNIVLTLLTALCGFFVMIAYDSGSGV